MLNFYIDESGSNGDKLLNEDQPTFVYGGWIIQDQCSIEIQDDIKQLRGTSSELHYKEMSTKQAIAANELLAKYMIKAIEDLQQKTLRILPVFVIANKKIILCEKFQYALFDSVHGSKKYKQFIDLLSIFGLDKHKQLTKEINELFVNDSNMLRKLDALYQNKDKDPNKTLEEFIQSLKKINVFDKESYYETYKGFLDDVDRKEILDEFCNCDDDLVHSNDTFYSSGLAPTAISPLLDVAEYVGQCLNSKVNVYTDNDTNKAIAASWRTLNKYTLNRADAASSPILHKYVQQIKMEDSKCSFGIQMADILCSSINEYIKISNHHYTARYKKQKNMNNDKHQKYLESLKDTMVLLRILNEVTGGLILNGF